MRILMKTTAAGPQGTLLADKEYDVADGLGDALCSGGYAERRRVAVPVKVAEPEPVDEVADAEPVVERAVTRGRRGR